MLRAIDPVRCQLRAATVGSKTRAQDLRLRRQLAQGKQVAPQLQLGMVTLLATALGPARASDSSSTALLCSDKDGDLSGFFGQPVRLEQPLRGLTARCP